MFCGLKRSFPSLVELVFVSRPFGVFKFFSEFRKIDLSLDFNCITLFPNSTFLKLREFMILRGKKLNN
jgi:hypothetical protein